MSRCATGRRGARAVLVRAVLVRAALGSAILVGAALITAPGAAPAVADPIGYCTRSTGTIVAVDFAHWGGPIVRGCGTHAASGYALLHAAQFTTAGDQRDGPAFICRLGNPAFRSGTPYPTPSDEKCAVTPPSSASWSYWLAAKGAPTWTYGQNGAMSDQPQQGEVQLWQFGGANASGTPSRPTISPQQLRATNSSSTGGGSIPVSSRTEGRNGPVPTTPSAVATRHPLRPRGPGASPDPAARTTPSTGSDGEPRSTSGTSSGPGSSGAPGGVTSPVTGASGPSIIDAQAASAAATKTTSTGSAAAVVVGLALALLLGGGAGWTMLRRRRAELADY